MTKLNLNGPDFTTIFVTPNFCTCRLCKPFGNEPFGPTIKTDLDRTAYAHLEIGWKTVKTGGRGPVLITFDPDNVAVAYETATGNLHAVSQTDPREPWELEEVFKIDDSPHGCHKIRKNQTLRFYSDLKVKVVYTR